MPIQSHWRRIFGAVVDIDPNFLVDRWSFEYLIPTIPKGMNGPLFVDQESDVLFGVVDMNPPASGIKDDSI
jgi:hypothetical protein